MPTSTVENYLKQLYLEQRASADGRRRWWPWAAWPPPWASFPAPPPPWSKPFPTPGSSNTNPAAASASPAAASNWPCTSSAAIVSSSFSSSKS
jgi:hypothetical protein